MHKINFFNTTNTSDIYNTLPTLQQYLASFSFNAALTEEMVKFSDQRTLKHQTHVFNNLKILK